jgi:hypothetical protein
MIRITDLCLRLGRVNEAERFSHEASILGSGDARVLSQIAQVQLIQGRAAAARKTLQALAGETGSARWSRERLAELDTDPQLVSVRNVQLLRRRMLRNDDVFPVWQNPDKPEADLDRMLLDQLEQDPSNRMAFEYLMGNYLLARDLAAARALAPRIQNMTGPAYESPGGKRRTPRHYQEAMALYADTGGKPVEAGAFEIEPGTLERMTVFKRIMAGSPSREAAKAAAWETFRHTYFFYFVFGPGDYR